MTIQLHLYSTSYCHLCEQAESLLQELSKLYDMQWLMIEIADNTLLLERYEIKIPVLKRLDTNTEIFWPFNSTDIYNLLNT
jgi:hypothetical protein